MKASIHVGNDLADGVQAVLADAAGAIERVFESGRENCMDQATVVRALAVLTEVAQVREVTITNSTFTGDKVVHMDDDR